MCGIVQLTYSEAARYGDQEVGAVLTGCIGGGIQIMQQNVRIHLGH